jgi:hypothetical protein
VHSRLSLADEGPSGRRSLMRAKNQPAGVENGRRGGRPVSGLFFTGSFATTARAADTEIESRQIIPARPCCIGRGDDVGE